MEKRDRPEIVGEALYRAMQWLEPDGVAWAKLSDRDREFYMLAMERALEYLGDLPAGSKTANNMISGGVDPCE